MKAFWASLFFNDVSANGLDWKSIKRRLYVSPLKIRLIGQPGLKIRDQSPYKSIFIASLNWQKHSNAFFGLDRRLVRDAMIVQFGPIDVKVTLLGTLEREIVPSTLQK